MGYHLKKIKKGKLGEFSKIQEEFEELLDAVEQDNVILQLCEIADLLGAIDKYCVKFNLTLKDVLRMTKLTESAFKDGSRK